MIKSCDTALAGYELMIGGVLKAGGIYRRNENYEDYRQELRLLILKRLLAGEALATQHNPQLFKWLLWRLRDLQKVNQRYSLRHEFAGEVIENIDEQNHFAHLEWVLSFEKGIRQRPQHLVLHQLLLDFVHYPDDLVTNRCDRLKIHRATYNRRLKLLQQTIHASRYA